MAKRITIPPETKLKALSLKYYDGYKWQPGAGDLYTSTRVDNEVYKVVEVADKTIGTIYCNGKEGAMTKWPKDGFLSEGFGKYRVYIPVWLYNELKEVE